MVNKDYFGESKNIEFKEAIPKRHEKFLKDIIAFSNCTGGKVILGIEDDTNIVKGIGEQNPFKLSDDISNMISDACTPQIEPDISMQTIEGKTVLVIDVSPGKFRPYYIKSMGKESSAYIRINGTSRPADGRKLQELELEGQRISYDSMQAIGNEYNEKEAMELCAAMKEIALKSCETEEEKAIVRDMTIYKLEDMGLLCKVGRELYPTNAFMLMTNNRLRYAKIQCALFKGINRDIFIDKREFDGPIYEQIEEAYQFVLKHINLGAEIEGLLRKDVYELPIKAVREMIANAVAHRSYLDDSCIQVSIFDDRVEVLSPGMLYGGLDMESAKLGKSRCRNAAICEAFHYMHIVEQWGTGIPRIISKCKEYGLPEPLFQEFGDGIKVTMFRKVSSDIEKIDNEEQKIDINVEKVDNEEKKVSSGIEKTSNDEEKVSNDEEKVSNDEEKVSNDEEKVSNDEEKVSNGIEKIGNEGKKVSSDIEKISNDFEYYKKCLERNSTTKVFVENIQIVFGVLGEKENFKQSDIMKELKCSKSKATNIIREMKQAGIVEKVSGFGPGRYRFVKY